MRKQNRIPLPARTQSLAAVLVLGLAFEADCAGPLLTIAHNGSNAIVTFAGRLQSAEHAHGPYTDNAQATSPHVWSLTNAATQFWRTRFARDGTISAGSDFTAALKTDGTLWTWGGNGWGQLGSENPQFGIPTEVGETWVALACGVIHAAAIKSDSTVWHWGLLASTNRPVRLGADAGWVGVSCGDDHVMLLKGDGSLWGWGYNNRGQLGIGTYQYAAEPTRVGSDTNWSSVACGFYYTLAIKTDGSLWAWGNNRESSVAGGQFVNTNAPARIDNGNDWRAVTCGFKPQVIIRVEGYAMAIKTEGSLWGIGYNRTGQLGNGTLEPTNQFTRVGTESDWVGVAGGHEHTLGLRTDGSLWVWGRIVGGTVTNRPVRIGVATDWTAVAGGAVHSVALKGDGSLWAWGANTSGQLGNGAGPNVYEPARVGSESDWRQ